MTISFSLAQAKGFTLAENFSFKRSSTINAAENEEKRCRFVRGAFDGNFALKGFGTFTQCIEFPLDPQDIFDNSIPFNSLVLKPQLAAFGEEFEDLAFFSPITMKIVGVVFTNTELDAGLPEDGPGMWVLVIDVSNFPSFQLEQAIRVTDGTDILIPEVHLAELTGVFGDMQVLSDSTILPDSETWAKCLPFARFCYSSVLTLPQTAYDVLLPQLPLNTLVAITE